MGSISKKNYSLEQEYARKDILHCSAKAEIAEPPVKELESGSCEKKVRNRSHPGVQEKSACPPMVKVHKYA